DETKHRRPDDLDRLELARLLALVVDALHRADVITAGLGWQEVLYSLEPRPTVLLHVPDGIRPLGGEFLGAPDIAGHETNGGSFDRDRYQLALVLYGLLVSHDPDAPLDPWNPEAIPGLTREQARRAYLLWERAAG